MNAAVIVNMTKEKALVCANKVADILLKNGARVYAVRESAEAFEGLGVSFCVNIRELFSVCDAAVTVGGDGTIIHAAKYAAETNTPLIGVNVGRLGFAADLETDEIEELKRIITGDFTIDRRMLLDVEVQKPEGLQSYLAVNDAVVAHGQFSKIVDFSLMLGNEEIARYRADGILFSTPTGSTAYSLSAGGPIVSPQIDCVLMTPVCPHSLFSRSVLFEGSSRLSVAVKIPQGCSCLLTVDGEVNVDIAEGDRVSIKKSQLSLELISLKKRNFYLKLNKKLKEREL